MLGMDMYGADVRQLPPVAEFACQICFAVGWNGHLMSFELGCTEWEEPFFQSDVVIGYAEGIADPTLEWVECRDGAEDGEDEAVIDVVDTSYTPPSFIV